jgi:hypothetical protein
MILKGFLVPKKAKILSDQKKDTHWRDTTQEKKRLMPSI